MTFAAIQQLQASDKFLLVRANPSRWINDDLTVDTGTVYTATFTYPISEVKENGTALSLVTGSPASGEYSYDEDNNLLTVHLSAAPSASNAIVLRYFTFFTTSRVRVVTEDPEVSSDPLREWEPRILKSPSVEQDASNVLDGYLDISSSSMELINNEQELQQYFGDNDSWFNAPITMWHCLNSVDNIQKIFEGKIIAASLSRKSLVLSMQDKLRPLKDPALMGDSVAYFSKADFANVDPNREGLPIPFIFGSASRYKLLVDSATSYGGYKLDPDTLYDATCTNFSTTISTSTNREYGVCRVATAGFLDFSFTPSAINSAPADYQVLTGTVNEIAKFRIGDTFIDSSSNPHRVLDVGSTTITITKLTVFSGSVSANNCPSIVITTGGNDYYLLYSRDYTATVTATSGGNKYLKITLVNNFEATFGISALDPQISRIRYRVRPAGSQLHGDVMDTILSAAGLGVDATAIAAANAVLPVNAAFSIPQFDETDHGEYYKYIQLILKSAFGFIYLNNSGNIGYELFATPTSTDQRTDTDIEEDTFNINLQYQDIVTQIIGYNPHASSIEYPNSAASASSVKAQYLHGVNRATRYRHILENFSTRVSDILDVLSNRRATYEFSSKQLDYDSEIGDDVELSKNNLLGNDSARDVKILGLNKRVNKTIIKAIDLLEL